MLKPKQMLPLLSAAFLLMASTAMADSKRFSDVDTNGNGALSYRELVNAFGREGANRLWERNGGRQLRDDDVRGGSDDDRDDDGDDDRDDDDRDDNRDDDNRDDDRDDDRDDGDDGDDDGDD